MPKLKYTKEQIQYIHDNYKGITTAELQERFNKRFGTNLTQRQIFTFKKNHKLKNGIDTRKKPYEIGSKRYCKTRKKIMVKVAEGKWMVEGRANYIREYGEIPDNYVLIHLDSNNLNSDVSNLKVIPKNVWFYMKQNNMFSDVPETTEINCSIAMLQCQKFKARKKLGRRR